MFWSSTIQEGLLKAFLLAAGNGTRLRPLTDRIPKCLVPIQGISILEIWLDLCCSAGIDQVLVNLHAHSDLVRSALVRHENRVRTQLFQEPTLLGSAGTLRQNREWIAGDPDFWVFYSDVLTNLDLSKMLTFHRNKGAIATIGVYQVEDPSRCGVVTFDKNFVVSDFVEKPTQPTSNWVFSGVLVATPKLLDTIPDRVPVDLGFDVLPRLVGRIVAYPISEFLLDIGTRENYQAAQMAWPGLKSLGGPQQVRTAGPRI